MKKFFIISIAVAQFTSTASAGWLDSVWNNLTKNDWLWGLYEEKSNFDLSMALDEWSLSKKLTWSSIRWQGVNSRYRALIGKDHLDDISFYVGFAIARSGFGVMRDNLYLDEETAEMIARPTEDSHNYDVKLRYGRHYNPEFLETSALQLTPYIGIQSTFFKYRVQDKIWANYPDFLEQQPLAEANHQGIDVHWTTPSIGVDAFSKIDNEWALGSNISVTPTGRYTNQIDYLHHNTTYQLVDQSKIKGYDLSFYTAYTPSKNFRSELVLEWRNLNAHRGDVSVTQLDSNETTYYPEQFLGAHFDDKSIHWRLSWHSSI